MNDFLEEGFKSLPVWLQAIITAGLFVIIWVLLRPQPVKKVSEE
jgi:hypothetical protein